MSITTLSQILLASAARAAAVRKVGSAGRPRRHYRSNTIRLA